MFSSTLHHTPDFEWSFRDRFYGYLLHGHYSGCYPSEGMLAESCRPLFEARLEHDASADYYYSSVASQQHFGDMKITWTPRRVRDAVLLFLVNPFAWATWLYHGLGVWMWQFGENGLAERDHRPMSALWYLYSPSERPLSQVPG